MSKQIIITITPEGKTGHNVHVESSGMTEFEMIGVLDFAKRKVYINMHRKTTATTEPKKPTTKK